MIFCRIRGVALASAAFFTVVGTPSLSVAQHGTSNSHAADSFARKSTGVIAFVDVSVVPMDQDRVLANQTVLVKDGRIVSMGPASRVRVPRGAQRIEGKGKFLLPGLADMHAHFQSGVHIATSMTPMGYNAVSVPFTDSVGTETRLFMWLANGVTTVRNLDYFDVELGQQAMRLRARAETGELWLPHIYTAGEWAPLHYIGFPQGGEPPPRMDSIATYIAAYKAAGYDQIKVHNEAPEILDSVLAAARRVGIPVVGHVPPPTRIEHILPLGYKSIEHPFSDYLWNNRQDWNSPDTTGIGALLAAVRDAHVWHCPTEQHYDRLHPGAVSTLKIEQDSGVKLLLGTDEVPWRGVITRELQAMVAGGLTPYQALVTGTRNVAEYFGTLNQTGTVAVGKRADLVLLEGNPLQDIRFTAQAAGVMVSGRWLSREEMERRIATFHFPTFDHNGLADTLMADAPVKSYWHNVADEISTQALPVFGAVALTDSEPVKVQRLRLVQQGQMRALSDSLGASTQFKESVQRIITLTGRQLGEYRAELTPQQQIAFDPEAKAWIIQRMSRGFTVAIPGVQ